MRSCSRIGILVAGWYLITPRFVGGNIDKKAPLSRWDEEADFTSLGDCSDERDRQLQGVTEELDEINGEYRVSPSRYFRDLEQHIDLGEIANGLVCISSEDSRLERTEPLHSGKISVSHLSSPQHEAGHRRSRRSHLK
jgi:hypothetical protein